MLTDINLHPLSRFMTERYYLDTSIYLDYYQNRTDSYRPLGDFAHRLLATIEERKDQLLISDFLLLELEKHCSKEQVKSIFEIISVKSCVLKVDISSQQRLEAREIAIKRNVAFGDALHAILARDNNATLVSRDKHFLLLLDVSNVKKPEDLI